MSMSSVRISTTNPAFGLSLGTRLCLSTTVRKGKYEHHSWEETATHEKLRKASNTKAWKKDSGNRIEVEASS